MNRTLEARRVGARPSQPSAPWALPGHALPLLLAFVLPAAAFLLQKDIGLSLADEGFLWYGAQRVLAGEVPVRDFQAYDIGRYYWYALWMGANDSAGIVPLRAGSAWLAGASIAIAVVLAGSVRRLPAFLAVLAAGTFALWMAPSYKVADNFAALMLTAGLAGLVARPTWQRWWVYGVCVGAAGVVGINHAFYGTLAGILAGAWVRWQQPDGLDLRSAAAVVAGAAVGYAPVLAFMVFVPGFAAAFVDSIVILFEMGSTNLSRPLPPFPTAWPADPAEWPTELRRLVNAVTFRFAFPAFLCLCLWRVMRGGGPRAAGARDGATRPHPVFVAATLASIPYAHYIYSRPDFVHLSVSVMPLLVAAWTYPRRRAAPIASASASQSPSPSALTWSLGRSLALCAVSAGSFLIAAPEHEGFALVRDGRPLEPVRIGDEVLRIDPVTAAHVRLLQEVVKNHAPDGRAIYAAPYAPGAYAVTFTRSPTWEIYALFPATPARQQRELARLREADIGAAVISQHRVDDREDLGFANTHPILMRHIAECMTPVAGLSPPPTVPDVRVFAARPSSRCVQR